MVAYTRLRHRSEVSSERLLLTTVTLWYSGFEHTSQNQVTPTLTPLHCCSVGFTTDFMSVGL